MIKILKYNEVNNAEIVARFEPTSSVEDIVADIIANVRKNGDKALYEYTARFDKAELTAMQVTPEEIDEAVAAVEPEFIAILKKAAANIRSWRIDSWLKDEYFAEKFVIEVGKNYLCTP